LVKESFCEEQAVRLSSKRVENRKNRILFCNVLKFEILSKLVLL